MNLSTGPVTTNSGRSFGLHHITAVCGLALAVSAAVALGGWQTTAKAPSAVPSAAPLASVTASTPLPIETGRLVYFIVGSQVQADVVRAQMEQDNVGLPPQALPTVQFVVAKNSDAAAVISIMLLEQVQTGDSFSVVDLR